MVIDKFGNNIYQDTDIIKLLYTQDTDVISNVLVEHSHNVELFKKYSNLELKHIDSKVYYLLEVHEFDKICQDDWFIPEEYKNMDIEGFLVHVCPKQNYQRLIEELQEFRSRNMLPLLKTLKYLVDTFRKHNIIWGVGRGSSVASYTLYLLGVHKIDSVKYNLEWQEFLR